MSKKVINDNEVIDDALKFDINDFELFLTTKNKNYYLGNKEGFFVTDLNDNIISEPSNRERPLDVLFKNILTQELAYIPFKSHFEIRSMIKNDIVGNKKLEEKYKEGIENYKKYCRERFITSRDIIRHIPYAKFDDINIIDEDYELADNVKMFKLHICIDRLKVKNLEKYKYVASLNNGVDYYYCNDKYVAVDDNLVAKSFKDKPAFLLDELKKKYKFVYIADNEIDKLSKVIMQAMKERNSLLNNEYGINEFSNYLLNKQVDFMNENLGDLKMIVLYSTINKGNKERIKQRNEMVKEYKKTNKNVEMSLN